MARTSTNMAVDAAALAGMALLASTGFVLVYRLPPGSGGRDHASSAPDAVAKPIATLWGWTRHQWGDLHFWLAMGVLALIAVHLTLHWKWVVSVLQKRGPQQFGRAGLVAGVLGCAGVLALIAAPLLWPLGELTSRDLRTSRDGSVPGSAADVPLVGIGPAAEVGPPTGVGPSASLGRDAAIRGQMTFAEVAHLLGTTTQEVLQRLNLPADVPSGERLGRIAHTYGRSVDDFRAVLQPDPRSTIP
ncbi:MAG: DUF4405 domain-containing protein [Planctomycetales bacterium]|nr:DUF4405 domain-containing protein [Planctomycetales bacterium]